MDFEMKKQKILNALIERGGIQRLIDAAAEVLKNPIFIADMSLHAIAYSRSVEGPADIGWNVVKLSKREQGTGVREACLQEIINSGAIEKTARSDEPYISSYSFTPYRYVGCRIRDHHNIIANATLIEIYKPFTEEDSKLLQIFCKVVVFEILSKGNSEMQAVKYFGLMTDLLDGHRISEADLNSRGKMIGVKFPRKMQLALLRSRDSSDNMPLYHIRSMIMRHFPSSLSIVYHGEIVVLLPAEGSLAHIIVQLKAMLKCCDMVVGISRTFTDPCQLWIYYQQADRAIWFYKDSVADTKNCVCFYDKIMIRHLVDCVSGTFPANAFIDPLLLELQAYDRENNTAFVRDLAVYLESGRNIRKAAERLFVHKNSMYYKISRIEQILGVSLSDEDVCFSLQLSLRLFSMTAESALQEQQ